MDRAKLASLQGEDALIYVEDELFTRDTARILLKSLYTLDFGRIWDQPMMRDQVSIMMKAAVAIPLLEGRRLRFKKDLTPDCDRRRWFRSIKSLRCKVYVPHRRVPSKVIREDE